MGVRIIALLVLFASSLAHAGPQEDAVAAYQKFFTAFVNDNQDQMATLFAPDAQFFGTNSQEVVTSPDGIRKYFAVALDPKRGVVKAVPFAHTALVLSDDVVLIAGKWQSERTLDGKMTTGGPSRNTVVMQKRGGRWLIAQFHNSPTPKPAS